MVMLAPAAENALTTDSIRVLIADDEPMLRQAIADLIRSEPGLELAGAAADADEAIALAGASAPDVALVDVRMPGGGEHAAREIRRRSPGTRVIALSAYDDGATAVKMLLAGAIGYLVKGVSSVEIAEAIRRAARGQSSLAVAITDGVVEELARSAGELRSVELALRISEKNLRALRDSGAAVAEDAGAPVVPGAFERRGNRSAIDRNGAEPPSGRAAPAAKIDRSRGRALKPRGLSAADRPLGAMQAEERTLLAAFVRDMSELGERRRRAQAESAAAARRELLERLVASGEDERRRIAADIHDDSIQAITAAGMRLQMLKATLAEPRQLDLIGEIEETIQVSISRLRHLLFELLPPALDADGLTAALRTALDAAGKHTEISFRLEDGLTAQPSAATGLILYRIAQEALANIRKHAQASNVTIRLDEVDAGYRLRVIDDGVGFAADNSRSAPGHLGLTAMHERAELAGGRLCIDSTPGSGTVLECWIPDAELEA